MSAMNERAGRTSTRGGELQAEQDRTVVSRADAANDSAAAQAEPWLLAVQRTMGNQFVQRLVQRTIASDGQHSGPDEDDFSARLCSATGGASLAPAVQRQLESKLDTDLSGVRVHTDSGADRMARDVDAVAFTSGSDIYFRSGAYQPDTQAGQQLLAHEATHVAQQAAGPVSGTPGPGGVLVSDPDDSFEQAAQRVAVGPSESAGPVPSGSTAGVDFVQRFGSEEHRQLGAEASGGASTDLDLGDGTTLTYGEMVALAGDYFGSLQEMRDLSSNPAGQEQLRFARWDALHIGSEPAVDESAKTAVRDRYYRLAANNWSHFSAGGTAGSTYEDGHRAALDDAFMAGASADDARWQSARTAEAFCNHFLTDMFAAGHVRTPRQEMKKWYQDNFPDSVDRFVSYAADQVTSNLDSLGDIPWYWPNAVVAGKLRDRIRDLGGSAIDSFSLGDIVALAYHNQDNAGLGVVSEVDQYGIEVPGGFYWTAKGDSHLAESPITREMAIAAVRASLAELDAMREAGLRASGGACQPEDALAGARDAAIAGMGPFTALKYTPREANYDGVNPVMNWTWGSLDPVLHQAVDEAVRDDIANTLRGKAAAVPEELRYLRRGREDPDGAVHLHARQAFMEFCDQLAAQGVAAIEAAMGTPATAAVPADAGVPLPAGVPDDSSDAGTPDAGVGAGTGS
jgi:Domain of unknown function (DUF4157)